MAVLGALMTASCAAPAQPAPETAPTGPGPLTEIAYTTGFLMDDAASVLASVTIRENATAACMHDLGFDYVLKIPDVAAIELPDEDGPVEGTAEFAAAYGYGVWTTPDGLAANSAAWTIPDLAEEEAYLASMSETELTAYFAALYGEPDPDDPTFVTGGCLDVADRPGADDAEQAYLAGVREEMMAFLVGLPEAPELAEVNGEWAACLREAGYPFANPGAARRSVVEEFDALLATTGGMMPASAPAEHAPAEIALAVADLACRAETDFEARSAAITSALEAEWVEVHRAEVDAYLDAVAAWRPVTD